VEGTSLLDAVAENVILWQKRKRFQKNIKDGSMPERDTIFLTRELGMNPKKFGSLANTKQESWKLSLPEFIAELYFKHFKKRLPDNVRSIEQMVNDYNRKEEERRARRLKKKESQQSGENVIQL